MPGCIQPRRCAAEHLLPVVKRLVWWGEDGQTASLGRLLNLIVAHPSTKPWWPCCRPLLGQHQKPDLMTLLCLLPLSRTAPVASVVQHQLRYRLFSMSSAAAAGPTTATPPANTARGATADLADVFIPEPVDEVAQRKVNIMEPIFQ